MSESGGDGSDGGTGKEREKPRPGPHSDMGELSNLAGHIVTGSMMGLDRN